MTRKPQPWAPVGAEPSDRAGRLVGLAHSVWPARGWRWASCARHAHDVAASRSRYGQTLQRHE